MAILCIMQLGPPTHPTASVENQRLMLFLTMLCDVPTTIVPPINKVCAVMSPQLILGPSLLINLAQLAPPSVALLAELVLYSELSDFSPMSP